MPLEQHPLLGVRYAVRAGAGRAGPGHFARHENTVGDLLWLRQSGLEAAVLKLAAGGTPVLGVCGGYQMLGETLDDSQGTERPPANAARAGTAADADGLYRRKAPRTGHGDGCAPLPGLR